MRLLWIGCDVHTATVSGARSKQKGSKVRGVVGVYMRGSSILQRGSRSTRRKSLRMHRLCQLGVSCLQRELRARLRVVKGCMHRRGNVVFLTSKLWIHFFPSSSDDIASSRRGAFVFVLVQDSNADVPPSREQRLSRVEFL